METDWSVRGKEVFAIEIEALSSLHDRLGKDFSAAVELLGSCQGRVVVTGIGKSGLVGRKLAATFSSTGTPAFFLHPVEGAHGDLGAIRADDVILAISYSGKSEELNAILPTLKKMGASILALTSNPSSPMARLADITLDISVPREACPLNLAPTSSTTATLALGDALAVCLIERNAFTANDFKVFHPAGSLGQRLSLKVADIMHTGAMPVVEQEQALHEAIAVLDAGKLGAVLIVDEQNILQGILTDGDIRRIVFQNRYAPEHAVAKLMTLAPLVCQPTHSAAEVLDMMEQKMVTVLPVVDEHSCLVGMVHLHDLLGKGQVKFAG